MERFLPYMRQILDMVKKTQPDADIYILSLVPVGRLTPDNISYNPENVTVYNQALKALSREYGTEYLDMFRLLSDPEGYYQPQYDAGDGIHIQALQYGVLKDFLKCHTK